MAKNKSDEPESPLKEHTLDDNASVPVTVRTDSTPSGNDTNSLSNDETSTTLDDKETGEAIDDIAVKESDTLLALDDVRSSQNTEKATPGWKNKIKNVLKSRWTWAGVVLIILILFALPFTRYPILGLVIKKPVTVTVIDSKTGTPVSSAEIQIAGTTAKTDAYGKAHLKAALGKHALVVSKQYYQSLDKSYFVGFKSPSGPQSVRLIATGRLVPLVVTNRITGKPIADALFKLKGTTAKTNSQGKATIALPTTSSSYSATLSLSGYNTLGATVTLTDQAIKANSFQLTPSGQIYFLSNLSGTIDVVKSNLDGTGRSTVLAGTGQEDPNNTTLLASRDWQYLVLESARNGGQPALYLINTANDKVTEFDNSGGNITLVGWYDHDFVYDLTKPNLSNWQAGKEVLKSYDADNLQLNQLDQNQASGSSTSYAYQAFANFYIVNGAIVYSTQWFPYSQFGSYDTTGLSDTIRAVQPNGQNKKDYLTLSIANTASMQGIAYSPQAIYFSVFNNDGSTSYYSYQNRSVQTISITSNTFSASYPTYLLSPSGNSTFWTELRDGQNTLFTGDSDGSSSKQIATLSDYSPYGWYSDNYVLVSKNSSQLYIMPASGLSGTQQPIKITDYFKPAQTYAGYGYGYGGL